MSKIPPKPKTPRLRIKRLIAQCMGLRRGMNFSRRKFMHLLNGSFLHKEDRVSYESISQWENGLSSPCGEAVMALVAFRDWAKSYKETNGFLYQPVKYDAPRVIYDGDHAPLPGERPKRFQWAMKNI